MGCVVDIYIRLPLPTTLPSLNPPTYPPTQALTFSILIREWKLFWCSVHIYRCPHENLLSFLLPSCNHTCLSIQLWDVWFKFFVLFHKFQIFTYGQLNFLLQTESIDLAERQEKSSQKVFARSNDNNMSSSIDSDGLPYIGQVCYMLRDCHLLCHFLFTGTDLIKIHCLYRW